MKIAIVVIDMEKDFFNKNLFLNKGKVTLVKNTNDLIDLARSKMIPIIWIKQEFKSDLSDAYLFMKKTGRKITIKGTAGAQILDELNKKTTDIVIIKNRYSAFFKTQFEKILKSKKIDTLVLAGINTHACVRMTAIDAYQRDLQVILAKDCVLSWNKKHGEISIAYLKNNMGIQVLTNKQLLNKF